MNSQIFEGQTVIFEESRGYMGKTVRRPINDFAIAICNLIGISTLTDQAIERIKAQGIPIMNELEALRNPNIPIHSIRKS
jgi:hypothetical protein